MAMQWSGSGTACRVLVLDTPDLNDDFALRVTTAITARDDCTALRLPAALALLDPGAVRVLMAKRRGAIPRLACVGHGPAAYAAMRVAAEIGADAVLAVAPEPATLTEAPHCPTLVVTGAEAAKAALALRKTHGLWVDHTEVPAVALPVAITQSGGLEVLVEWLVAGGVPPRGALLRDWRAAMAHRIEIDPASAYCDPRGGLHLSGSLHNCGTRPLRSGRDSPDRVLIGARLLARDGTPIGSEAYGLPATACLQPGESARFRLHMADAAAHLAHGKIAVSLLCEGRFRYDQVGFTPSPARDVDDRDEGNFLLEKHQLARALHTSTGYADINTCSMEQTIMSPSILDAYKQARSASGTTATLDDLWFCYRLFLDREPDPAGFGAYAAIIQRGMTVDELMRMFVSSPEYARRIQAPADPTITRVSLDGFDLFVPLADAVVGEEILSRGVYEPHVTAALARVLRPGQLVVDIGANIGYFTVMAAKAVGASGRVIAVEPLTRNVRLLLANSRINHLGNVDILPFGVGDTEGFVTLLSMGSIASSRALEVDDVVSVNALEFAYARTIDSIVPGDRPVDVLKIDIDGFDHKALLGAQHMLERDHPILFAEFAPALLREFSGIDPEAYLGFLAGCGYTDFTILNREGPAESAGSDIARIARLPDQIGATHVDLMVRRL